MGYDDICRQSDRDRNDCTVIAVSVTTGVSYDKAQRLLAAAGRVKNKGCHKSIYHKVIRDLGFKIQRIKNRKLQTATIPYGIRQLTSKTVRTVERELARNWGGCKVLVNIDGHILAWDGGEIVDWTVGRQHRVRSADVVYKGNLPLHGTTVAEPTRQSLNRVGHKRTGVMANILGHEPIYHRSVAAAYKAMNLDMRKHQKVRLCVKRHGKWVFYAYQKSFRKDAYGNVDPDSWSWEKVHVTIIKAE